MTGLKTLIAAALISTISAASAATDEPAAFQAQNPDRDVLNDGALTPAGRLGLERPGGAVGGYQAPTDAYAAMPGGSPSFRTPHRRHRSQ